MRQRPLTKVQGDDMVTTWVRERGVSAKPVFVVSDVDGV